MSLTKKGLANKHTTDKLNGDKPSWRHFDDYLNVHSGKKEPISEAGLERMGTDFVKWSTLDDSIVLEDFFRERGIPEMTYRYWKKQNELFRLRYETAKGNVGSRREKGALKRSYSERMVLTSMPKFDKSWSELEEWRSGLRSKEQAAGKGDIKVVMESYPKTDVVPEKKDDLSIAKDENKD